MKIFVRTTGSRPLPLISERFEVLLDPFYTGCKGYFEQMRMISQDYVDDVLILEDDIQLATDFFDILSAAVMYTNNQYIINMAAPVDKMRLIPSSKFMWTRAVYYPKKLFDNIFSCNRVSIIDYSVDKHYDILQRQCMHNLQVLCIPAAKTVRNVNFSSLMKY